MFRTIKIREKFSIEVARWSGEQFDLVRGGLRGWIGEVCGKEMWKTGISAFLHWMDEVTLLISNRKVEGGEVGEGGGGRQYLHY